mgnify:CR=1 FL=1
MPTDRRPSARPSRQWRQPVREEHIAEHSIPVASGLATLAAITLGLVTAFAFVMSVWLFAAHGNESTTQVVRACGISWLGVQLVPVVIGGNVLGLLPWGFLVIPVVYLWKSTHWAIKSSQPQSARDFWLVAGHTTLAYSFLGGLVGLISSTNDLYVVFWRAVVHCAIVSICVTVACIVTYAPSRSILIESLPRVIVDGLRPGALAAFVLVFVGALGSTLALVIHFNEVRSVAILMAPSFLDGLFLALLGIGYLPTAALWSMSYVIGPGFALGVNSAISATSATPGRLPAFPLLASVPSEALPYGQFIVIVPILAGLAMYLSLPRLQWRPQEKQFSASITHMISGYEVVVTFVANLVLAVIVFLLCAASSGSLGSNQLAFVGPKPLTVAISAFTICGFTALFFLIVPRFLISMLFILRHRDAPEEQ